MLGVIIDAISMIVGWGIELVSSLIGMIIELCPII
jgi:hypothetical protein